MRLFSRPLAPLAAVFLVLAAPGCDTNDGGRFDLDPYVGTYTGALRGSVTFLGETNDLNEPSTATFASAGAGRVRLTIGTSIANPESEPQVFEGTYDEDGMRFTLTDEATGQSVPITISPSGAVSGTARISQQGLMGTVTVSGSLTPSRFVMRQQLVTLLPALVAADVTFEGAK